MAATNSLKISAPILPNVTLCAIVRDEMQNPAGGIKDFLATHLPLVEEAVIVDTGSVDGTRELLNAAANKYSHLRVYDRKFKGFADARNYSIQQARTKYALVLDADERLFADQAELLAHDLQEHWPDILDFDIDTVYHPDDRPWRVSEMSDRIFRVDRQLTYKRDVFESLECAPSAAYSVMPVRRMSFAKLIHFLPSNVSCEKKNELLYSPMMVSFFPQPAELSEFSSWKELNPRRALYPFAPELLY